MYEYGRTALGVCVVGIVVSSVLSGSTPEAATERNQTNALRATSEAGEALPVIAERIVTDRGRRINVLLTHLKSHKGAKEAKADSPLHMAVKVVGTARALEAREALLEMIDLKIAFPVGDRHPLTDYYPCAVALAEIGGGPETLTMIERGIVKAHSVKRRRILTWVAYRMLDHELAVLWLEARATKVEKEAAKTLRMAAKEVVNGNKLLLMIYMD